MGVINVLTILILIGLYVILRCAELHMIAEGSMVTIAISAMLIMMVVLGYD